MIVFRKFIDRSRELKHLEREYSIKAFAFTVIYGRRRIGKTALIMQFAKKHPQIYFLADKRGTIQNVLRFRKKVASFFNDVEPAVETFDDLFEYISKRWNNKEKLIVAIDEFSYLVEKDDSIPSTFQLIIDETLTTHNNIYLIIAGSSVSMIEKGVLSYKSPLYGRRTSQIKLTPLAFEHLFEFFPTYSNEEVVRVYGALGGIPYYLNIFDPKKSFFENVRETFLNKENILFYEGEWLLRQELGDPTSYLNILSVIANGATRISEIANKSYMQVKDLPYYLRILQRLGLIEREIPALEKHTTRKSLYSISNNFLRFWFRYVFPNLGELESGDVENILESIKASYNEFLGKTFEEISMSFIKKINYKNKLPIKFRVIGRQWGTTTKKRKGYNQYEIDFVGVDAQRKKALIGEAKWKDNVNCKKILRELEEKAKFLQEKEQFEELYYCIIAKSFRERKIINENVLCFDLNDICSV